MTLATIFTTCLDINSPTSPFNLAWDRFLQYVLKGATIPQQTGDEYASDMQLVWLTSQSEKKVADIRPCAHYTILM